MLALSPSAAILASNAESVPMLRHHHDMKVKVKDTMVGIV